MSRLNRVAASMATPAFDLNFDDETPIKETHVPASPASKSAGDVLQRSHQTGDSTCKRVMDILAAVNDNGCAPRIHTVMNVVRQILPLSRCSMGKTGEPRDESRATVQPGRTKSSFPAKHIMTRNPITVRPTPDEPASSETEQQRFDRVLALAQFKPLKAILDHLLVDGAVMRGAMTTTNSYQNFLAKLGYRVVVVKQIHENDCYARLGPTGGIRAVLPVHDMATYSTMVTLVNFDSTVTTTSNSVDFYDSQLAEFKVQLMNRSGNAG
jgi:hypothetical protein